MIKLNQLIKEDSLNEKLDIKALQKSIQQTYAKFLDPKVINTLVGIAGAEPSDSKMVIDSHTKQLKKFKELANKLIDDITNVELSKSFNKGK